MRLTLYYKIAFFILCLCSAGAVSAQTAAQASLKFEQVEWNFGDIAEDGGTVEHTFTFVNNTTKPVVILDVTTGCGCTTTSYSRKPIMQGERGEVTVVFNPMNLPGRVTKSASILTSASSKPFVVTMQGNVIPRKKSVQEQWRSKRSAGLIPPRVMRRLRFYQSRVAVCSMLMHPRHCEAEREARLLYGMQLIKIVRVTAR